MTAELMSFQFGCLAKMNTGSYRKLIPLIKEIDDNDIIVTADDDVLYSEDWLSNIVKITRLHPNMIVCGRARLIKKNIVGRWQNYANWTLVEEPCLAMELLPIGCSGVAYKKKLLDLEFLTNQAYLVCAPTADDIWFRLASMRKGVKVYIDPEIDNKNVYLKHQLGLEQINVHRIKRNKQFYIRGIIRLKTEIMNYFGIPLSKNDFSWLSAWKYLNNRYHKNE